MNMAANSDKMAVTDTQSFPVHGSESRDDSDVKSQAKPNHEVTLKKKSTFKITSVTKSYGPGDLSNDHDHELDSMDDLDETMESHTEDASSEILDISKHTDGGEPSSPMEEETSDNVMNVKEKSDLQGPHSTRFKVVKIETREPFKRGRWTCLDTLDYPAPDKSDSKTNIDSNIGTSGVPTSTSLHQSVVVDEVYKNPTKAANVIQGENKENNLDNYQNSSTIRQSQLHQTQIQQTPASPNVHSNVAQQQIQTHPAHSNIQSNTVLSQSTSSVNTSIVQGQSSMQMNDQPQTTYIYTGAVPGPTASVIQNVVSSHSSIQNAGGSNFDEVQQFNQVQHVSNENLMPNVDNMEQNSTVSATMGADTQHNPITTEVPILTPQTVAEAVGIIPQEEDRNVYSRKLNNEVILFNRNGEMDNFRAAEHFSPFRTPGARGSSTVAIDNKIEQAMDLVKSHLMYAVREEVEVLKEQIKELMDKNSQLEYENQILKSSASPETLAKLSNLPSSSSS